MATQGAIDKRMLEVMKHCIEVKSKGVTNIKEWCACIGIEPNNISNITKGVRHFTVEQISNCCLHFGISADYIHGFTNIMYRSNKQITPIQLLKQAVRLVDKEMQGKRRTVTIKQKLKQK